MSPEVAVLWAARLGVKPSEVLDVYPDHPAGQLVVRLTGYRRRRLPLGQYTR